MTLRERIGTIMSPTTQSHPPGNGSGKEPSFSPADGSGTFDILNSSFSTRVTDEGACSLIAGGGPADHLWYELAQDMTDALEAWRQNFLIRQIIRLTTACVVGDGISIVSNQFAFQWFINRRLAPWCDELPRSDELFLALFPNPADGIGYVRAVATRRIEHVDTDHQDYEREYGCQERNPGCPASGISDVDRNHWSSPATAPPTAPVMLQFAMNQPLGATRGESDLTPILPWVKRHATWLKDRVKFNQIRTDVAAAEISPAVHTATRPMCTWPSS